MWVSGGNSTLLFTSLRERWSRVCMDMSSCLCLFGIVCINSYHNTSKNSLRVMLRVILLDRKRNDSSAVLLSSFLIYV